MIKFSSSAIFLPSIIYLLCVISWCNPAVVNSESSGPEPKSVVDGGRVLVLDQAHNTLMPGPYNASLYIDHLNMLLAQLPMVKMGIMGSLLSVVIPSLHIVLILSLIAFSITGTVAIFCAAFDCADFIGLGRNHHHRPYTSNFLKKSFRTSNANGVQPYYNNYPVKHWNSFENAQNLLDEAYDKYEE